MGDAAEDRRKQELEDACLRIAGADEQINLSELQRALGMQDVSWLISMIVELI